MGGYVAEFLPVGQRTWRMLKSGGKPIVFETSKAARDAAENAYLARLEPNIRATVPQDPNKIAAKLSDEAENWLRSKREDHKNAHVEPRPGKKPYTVLRGKVSA